ncbi:MAG: YvrJ family protein [Solirubrobacterales bacterium]
MYDQLVNLISNLGFPIAVSIYLLFRLEGRIDELIKAAKSLKDDIAVVIKNQEEK